ncbi:anti-phage BREX system Lon protease BrxL [Methanobrevibacter sp. 87.7]|uniref:anti-phage BREX system Lon protease BrxL n=1 Tax=Methanobrevibacter sp. 87.7 TaxID=387957 RepID=UPI001E58C264|nr:anti-phage BREX system Lon protease BrxL [Methanobrevibacter sp. 87.7]
MDESFNGENNKKNDESYNENKMYYDEKDSTYYETKFENNDLNHYIKSENIQKEREINFEDINSNEEKNSIYRSDDLNKKIIDNFDGKVVRKDLTKKIKEGANVPVYVLEYLLGKYCSTDESLIEQGVETVKKILADNYVRPDEADKIQSKIRELGSYSVIDVVSVRLDYRNDIYVASFSNLGLTNVPISEEYPSKYERLLGGNIWCMVQFDYYYDEADKNSNPLKLKIFYLFKCLI